MRKFRRPLAPSLLIAVLAATLLFAATAAAEIKIGEGTSPEEPALAGEADLLKASGEFDLATGTATFALTTREAQETTPFEKRPNVQYIAALVHVSFPCTRQSFEAESKKAEEEKKEVGTYPVYELLTFNRPMVEGPPGLPPAPAYGAFIASQKEAEGGFAPGNIVAGTKAMSGTTATISATMTKAANQPFNCAEVLAQNFGGGTEPDILLFPLTTKPEPPPVETPKPAPPAPAPAPPPAPGVFSFAKAKKPLKLEVEKWTTVKVKVTNTGGTTTATGSLRLKAPKGVVVKSGRQKLPTLPPGESWTVSYKVELTEKAKEKSTLSLVATAGAVTSKGSLVVKRKD